MTGPSASRAGQRGVRTGRACALVAALAVGTSAVAQAIVDDTAGVMPEGVRTRFVARLDRSLPDPASARIEHLSHPRAGIYCGDVEAQDAVGRSTGFKAFAYDDKDGFIIIEPPRTASTTADQVATRTATLINLQGACRPEERLARPVPDR